jgi:hypothetical protein
MIRFVYGLTIFLFLPAILSMAPEQKSPRSGETILIRKDRPSVYIEFEKEGKAEPLFQGEIDQRIWLTLHNNSPWIIEFCSFPVPKLLGDAGIVHTVKHIPVMIREGSFSNSLRSPDIASPPSRKELPTIPEGYSTGDTCTPYKLGSDRSISFSVPRNHLANDLFIEFEFWYEWENRDNELADYPQCLVSFSNSRLPKPYR